MHRSTPRNGLLAGLLAVVVFASGAVALTSRGTGAAAGTAGQAASAQTVSAGVNDDGGDGGHDGHHGDGH
ncbi:MAG: hypothetical protein QOH72_5042 [Solirubrobacteraceae bacterium]|jgi:hypothetical protein|nr:hypothetical protein [Solirubrobacteraceae bacterium]